MAGDSGKAAVKSMGGRGGLLVGLLLVFTVLAYIYYSPYQVLHDMRQELRNSEVDKLDQDIDYTAVREGLKRDFRSLAVNEVEDDPSLKNKLLGMLGLAFGAPVVDTAVDYVVSPAGLREVVNGVVPILSRSRTQADVARTSADADSGSTSTIKTTNCRYVDINEFIATISSKTGSATALTFSRRGLLSWQLTHIKLMPGHD